MKSFHKFLLAGAAVALVPAGGSRAETAVATRRADSAVAAISGRAEFAVSLASLNAPCSPGDEFGVPAHLGGTLAFGAAGGVPDLVASGAMARKLDESSEARRIAEIAGGDPPPKDPRDVPEPTSMGLLGIGLSGLLTFRRILRRYLFA